MPHFGETESIDYIIKPFMKYFEPVLQLLETKGYQRNHSIKAAPYDFRLTPGSNPTFLKNTISLIESMYESNNQ